MKGTTLDNRMLLLFGMPRSGTTWFGKLFDSHPDVIYLHEPDSEFLLKNVPLLLTSDKHLQYKDIINQYSNNLLKKCTPRVNGKTPFFKKNYLPDIKLIGFQYNIWVAKVFAKIGFSLPIFNPFNSSVVKNSIVAWKSIESCGRLGLILNSVENCKAIYIIRHPCGQVASVLNGENAGNFLSNEGTSEDYVLFETLLHSEYSKNHNLSIEKIKAMLPLERLAMRWVLFNEQAIEDIENSDNKAIIVRYEDICQNTEIEIKKLFQFSSLSWNTQTESFVNQSTLGNSESYYSVFKNTDKTMSKWKKFLSEDQIKIIQRTIRDSKSGKMFINDF